VSSSGLHAISQNELLFQGPLHLFREASSLPGLRKDHRASPFGLLRFTSFGNFGKILRGLHRYESIAGTAPVLFVHQRDYRWRRWISRLIRILVSSPMEATTRALARVPTSGIRRRPCIHKQASTSTLWPPRCCRRNYRS